MDSGLKKAGADPCARGRRCDRNVPALQVYAGRRNHGAAGVCAGRHCGTPTTLRRPGPGGGGGGGICSLACGATVRACICCIAFLLPLTWLVALPAPESGHAERHQLCGRERPRHNQGRSSCRPQACCHCYSRRPRAAAVHPLCLMRNSHTIKNKERAQVDQCRRHWLCCHWQKAGAQASR